MAPTRPAERQNWIVDEFAERVGAINATIELESGEPAANPVVDLLTPLRGIVGHDRAAAVADTFGASGDPGLCFDLGFAQYLPLVPASAHYRTKSEIVRVDLDAHVNAPPDAKPADLVTYAMTVRRVIDGDTREVAIALPVCVIKLKLRLRGLGCPEIDPPEVNAAKRETERLVAAAQSVINYTSKADRYDRFLAGVFIAAADGSENFLNIRLLEN